MSGEVTGIYVAESAGGTARSCDTVEAVAGKGLKGDRYFGDSGTFSDGSRKSQVTLIESEAIEALSQDYDIPLEAGQSRRNVVTRGIALNHMVSRKFTIGDIVCEGLRLCEPCMHLEGLTHKGVRKGLTHRGGLRATIVSGGTIRVGDAVAPVE